MEQKLIAPGGDIADAVAVRVEVFCDEQGFSREFEVDALDAQSWHVVFYDGTGPAATGRVYREPDAETEFHAGRIAALKKCRGTGLGREILSALEEIAAANGGRLVRLGAQCRARGFYEACGYAAYGDVYMDEHCEHIYMQKTL